MRFMGAEQLGPYILGPTDDEHQGIYTGDARLLVKEIPDGSVHAIFIDPPFFLPAPDPLYP